jgi:hypothetical protein
MFSGRAEPGNGSVRLPTTLECRTRAMTVKIRPTIKLQTMTCEYSAQDDLTIRYEELLRLRQVVRQTELMAATARYGIDLRNRATTQLN